MKRVLPFVLLLLVSVFAQAAESFPKKAGKARQSVASVMTFKDGVVRSNGTAVFVGGGGDVLVSYSLMNDADSAVVIDAKGKAHPVIGIVGLNSVYDCVKLRVGHDKKIPYLPVSGDSVAVGDELYMLSYGKKGSGEVTAVTVSAIDSLYSNAYYTLDIHMQAGYEALPLVNANGELVAIMQPYIAGDSCSYAIGSTMSHQLVATPITYGNGRYQGMGIRTLLPADKESALSCMYMQAVVGDSVSYRNAIDDFIGQFPKSHEGYLSKAEFMAVYCSDVEAADVAWEKSLKLADKPADVYFNKAKTIYNFVHSGDTVSHPMLNMETVLSALDKAIDTDNLPLYVNYKADVLFEDGRYSDAYECYMSLVGASLDGNAMFLRAAQCQSALKNYDLAIELMDSAINAIDETDLKTAASYIPVRALMKMSAGRYREAVFDYNKYEEITGSSAMGANFYYLRSLAEVKAKMYQQALNDLEKAISIESSNPSLYVEKGLLCYRLSLFEEGVETLEEALELIPDSPDVHYILGLIYARMDKGSVAEEYFLRAEELGHPDAGIRLKELQAQ